MLWWLISLFCCQAPTEAADIEAADIEAADIEAGQRAGGQLAVQAEARPLPIEADPRLAIEGPPMALAIRPEGIIAQQAGQEAAAKAEETAGRGCLAQFWAFFARIGRRSAAGLMRKSAQELERVARNIEA